MKSSKKILILTGDAGESFEVLFAMHRLREADYIPVIAAPAVRKLNLVMHDFEPGWDTYVERKGYLVESEIAERRRQYLRRRVSVPFRYPAQTACIVAEQGRFRPPLFGLAGSIERGDRSGRVLGFRLCRFRWGRGVFPIAASRLWAGRRALPSLQDTD